MRVELIDHMGTDASIIRAMLVSTGKDKSRPFSDADRGRLRYLIANKHASPFEHCVMTFYVECPLTVRSEWQRHRTFSYNEFSFRYATPEDGVKVYIPELENMRTQIGKPGHYTFETMNEDDAREAVRLMSAATTFAQWHYLELLDRGVAREVARGVLPVNTMTKFYATGNLRNWFNFLVLRNSEHAMREIAMLARDVEAIVGTTYPEAYAAWANEGGPQL